VIQRYGKEGSEWLTHPLGGINSSLKKIKEYRSNNVDRKAMPFSLLMKYKDKLFLCFCLCS